MTFTKNLFFVSLMAFAGVSSNCFAQNAAVGSKVDFRFTGKWYVEPVCSTDEEMPEGTRSFEVFISVSEQGKIEFKEQYYKLENCQGEASITNTIPFDAEVIPSTSKEPDSRIWILIKSFPGMGIDPELINAFIADFEGVVYAGSITDSKKLTLSVVGIQAKGEDQKSHVATGFNALLISEIPFVRK